MAVLADSNATGSRELKALQDAARARGVELSIYQIASAEEITASHRRGEGFRCGSAKRFVVTLPLRQSADCHAACRAGLPAIYQFPEEAEEGGFVAYGPSHRPNFS